MRRAPCSHSYDSAIEPAQFRYPETAGFNRHHRGQILGRGTTVADQGLTPRHAKFPRQRQLRACRDRSCDSGRDDLHSPIDFPVLDHHRQLRIHPLGRECREQLARFGWGCRNGQCKCGSGVSSPARTSSASRTSVVRGSRTAPTTPHHNPQHQAQPECDCASRESRLHLKG